MTEHIDWGSLARDPRVTLASNGSWLDATESIASKEEE